MNKNFNDFLKTLTIEDYGYILENAKSYLELGQKHFSNISIADFDGGQVFTIYLGTSFALSEKYHE